jgi:flagellar biosynthesis protein FlhF
MELKTYRAKSIPEALALVRRELGPQAAVLGTRELRSGSGALGWLGGDRLIEVTASSAVAIPSRLPPRPAPAVEVRPPRFTSVSGIDLAVHSEQSPAAQVEPEPARPSPAAAAAFQRLFTDLIDIEAPYDVARDLAARVMRSLPADEWDHPQSVQSHLIATVGRGLEIAGPIQLEPRQRRLVALVGPTGVGKTTTIAKLAAHFRLQERHKVGLITVDNYRIAAVEQLRMYAQIIDLPLEFVASPDQMPQAIARLADVELILVDTGGRSPRDATKIQELQALLAEVAVDEIHLVLSCTASRGALESAAECFAAVGANRLILTKLDEAQALGNLLPLLGGGRLPLSYLTTGQSVPDDIQQADAAGLARRIFEREEASDP